MLLEGVSGEVGLRTKEPCCNEDSYDVVQRRNSVNPDFWVVLRLVLDYAKGVHGQVRDPEVRAYERHCEEGYVNA